MQLSSSARDSMQLLHSPPRGALHRRRHQRAHSMTRQPRARRGARARDWGGCWGRHCVRPFSSPRGVWGSLGARTACVVGAPGVLEHPSLPPSTQQTACCSSLLLFCVCVRARVQATTRRTDLCPSTPTCARRPRPVPRLAQATGDGRRDAQIYRLVCS